MKLSLSLILSSVLALEYNLNFKSFNLNLNPKKVNQPTIHKIIDTRQLVYPRAIQFDEETIEYLSEEQIVALMALNVKFADVTDEETFSSWDQPKAEPLPRSPVFQAQVRRLFAGLDKENVRENLKVFTAFHNRYYKSSHGRDSQQWLLNKITEIASTSHLDIAISEFEHTWAQNSIIVKIAGQSSDKGATVITAHLDSTAGFSPMNARAPGADDNGSGTMTILEAFRVLVNTPSFRPKRPIEFHWYAAEEAGLLGSQAVVQHYRKTGQQIYGVLHMDMTAYTGKQNVVGIVTDHTNNELTSLLRKLVGEYLNIPAVDTRCGYACSDHASWTKNGYRSTFPIESEFKNSNRNIHSARDTIDAPGYDFDHIYEFAKLAVAFAMEMSMQ